MIPRLQLTGKVSFNGGMARIATPVANLRDASEEPSTALKPVPSGLHQVMLCKSIAC